MKIDESIPLAVGTAVSAKYRGAFCEATVEKIDRLIKCRIQLFTDKALKLVNEDDTQGDLVINGDVQVRQEGDSYVPATLLKIFDNSTYTVVFDDGDKRTLKRTQLVLKGDRHFKECENLDNLPLTNPEQFKNPVIHRKGRKTRFTGDDSSEEEDVEEEDVGSEEEETKKSDGEEDAAPATTRSGGRGASNHVPTTSSTPRRRHSSSSGATGGGSVREYTGKLAALLGELVKVDVPGRSCLNTSVGTTSSPSGSKRWFPALVVMPTASPEHAVKSYELLVRSFKDNKFFVVHKRDVTVLPRPQLVKLGTPNQKSRYAVEFAALWLDAKELPPTWEKEELLGPAFTDSGMTSGEGSDTESGVEEEKQEVKDHFIARLYSFMDDTGNPINKAPSVANKDLDLYKLHKLVESLGGYSKVSNYLRWPLIYSKMQLPPTPKSGASVIHNAYRKYLLSFDEMHRKLGTFNDLKSYGNRTQTGHLLSARERRASVMTEATRKKPTRRNIVDHTPLRAASSSKEVSKKEAHDDMDQVTPPGPSSSKSRPSEDHLVPVVKETNEFEERETMSTWSQGSGSRYRRRGSVHEGWEIAGVSPGVGALVCVRHGGNNVYEAKVVRHKRGEQGEVLFVVHYTGWNRRHDESVQADRIVSIKSDSKVNSSNASHSHDQTSDSSSVTAEKRTPVATATAPVTSRPSHEKRAGSPSPSSSSKAATDEESDRGATARTTRTTALSKELLPPDIPSERKPGAKSIDGSSTASSTAKTRATRRTMRDRDLETSDVRTSASQSGNKDQGKPKRPTEEESEKLAAKFNSKRLRPEVEPKSEPVSPEEEKVKSEQEEEKDDEPPSPPTTRRRRRNEQTLLNENLEKLPLQTRRCTRRGRDEREKTAAVEKDSSTENHRSRSNSLVTRSRRLGRGGESNKREKSGDSSDVDSCETMSTIKMIQLDFDPDDLEEDLAEVQPQRVTRRGGKARKKEKEDPESDQAVKPEPEEEPTNRKPRKRRRTISASLATPGGNAAQRRRVENGPAVEESVTSSNSPPQEEGEESASQTSERRFELPTVTPARRRRGGRQRSISTTSDAPNAASPSVANNGPGIFVRPPDRPYVRLNPTFLPSDLEVLTVEDKIRSLQEALRSCNDAWKSCKQEIKDIDRKFNNQSKHRTARREAQQMEEATQNHQQAPVSSGTENGSQSFDGSPSSHAENLAPSSGIPQRCVMSPFQACTD